MSELQISLLGIGVFVVLAVWGYGWWQQRQYRRRFGEVFDRKREDALQQAPAAVIHETPTEAEVAEIEAAAEEAVEEVVSTLDEEAVHNSITDEGCALVEDNSDYVTYIHPLTPQGVSALAPLWQQRFDFGKPVNACGLNATTSMWERVIPESSLFYSSYKISLQLVDRTGAVSETRLAKFRELIQRIATEMSAEAECPDVPAAARHAIALDAVCAEVDQIIGLNLVPRSDRQLLGAEIVYVASQNGFTLEADGSFQFLNRHGVTQFKLSNLDNVPFQHHLLNQMSFSGLTLLLEVPRVENPVERFDEMLEMARVIASGLRATVVDDRRKPLGDDGIAMIREQVRGIEQTMLAHHLVAGSQQALRLFS
jgi:FtsZ-interacting cell division protein ZipA